MTMALTNANGAIDTSGSTVTATGPIVVTFSGNSGAGVAPTCVVMSRSDTAPFVPTASLKFNKGRVKVNLISGDEFYFLGDSGADASVNISYVSA